MTAIHVNQAAGDDANTGGQGLPVRTLSRANALAVPGDTVVGEGGIFPEEILPADSNVAWLGEFGSDKKPLCKIDGGGTRQRAFYISGSQRVGVTISGWDIYGQTQSGIQLAGAQGVDNDHLVELNRIHDVLGTSSSQTGVRIDSGNPTVRMNHIDSIGPANESWGIFTGYTHGALVEDNLIHGVRKEAIRGFRDRDSVRRRNEAFNCWIGIADAISLSSLNYDNLLHHCTWGINPKHSNSNLHATLDAYGAWGVDPADDTIEWSRWLNNTLWDHTGAAIVFMNGENDASVPGGIRGIARQLAILSNIVGGYGADYFKDHGTGIDHDLVDMDYNVYSSRAGDVADANHYWLGYSFFTASEHLTLQGVRDKYGWEQNSVRLDPGLNDPDGGDYDYPNGSPMEIGGSPSPMMPHGTRRGARGLMAPAMLWTPRPVAFVSSSPTTGSPSRAVDCREGTYWTAAPSGSYLIADLGSAQPVNYAVADVYGHGTTANPKAWKIEASDSTAGPWTLAAQGTNFDSYQASHKYKFPTVTKRYLRYHVLTNFGDTAKSLVSEIRFGFQEEAPLVDTTPPAAPSITPASGVVPEAVMTWTAAAEAGATIRWTASTSTSSSLPADPTPTSGSVYTGSTTFTATATKIRKIKAIAIDSAGNVSPVTSRTWTQP